MLLGLLGNFDANRIQQAVPNLSASSLRVQIIPENPLTSMTMGHPKPFSLGFTLGLPGTSSDLLKQVAAP